MATQDRPAGWNALARVFHWAMAAIILGLVGVGLYMVEVLGDDFETLAQRYRLTQLHKSWGVVVFALAALRILWRAVTPSPELPREMNGLERAAAHGAHVALYGLMFALPLTGWLMASASPLNDPGAYPMQVKNMVFGLFELPDPYPKGDKALSETLAAIHFWCAMALLAVLAGHVAAALKHHYVNRDRVLMRMIRGR